MAGPTVSNLGLCMCTFGMAPMPLMVPPLTMTMADFMPAASIFASVPFMNIEPFILCTSPAKLILGVPTPCTPIPTPWIPTAPNVMVGFQPVLTADSMAFCAFGGMIKVLFPGEVNVISI